MGILLLVQASTLCLLSKEEAPVIMTISFFTTQQQSKLHFGWMEWNGSAILQAPQDLLAGAVFGVRPKAQTPKQTGIVSHLKSFLSLRRWRCWVAAGFCFALVC